MPANQFFNASLLGDECHEAKLHNSEPGIGLAKRLESSLKPSISDNCPYSQKLINNFESRVVILPNGCWGWKGGKAGGGTSAGQFCVSKKNLETTARASYKIYRGCFPKPAWIVRTPECVTEGCCNPEHLEIGDRSLSMKNAIARGSHNLTGGHNFTGAKRCGPKGEQVGASKLTDEKVIEIRALWALGGTTYTELAKQFGVTIQVPRRIIKGESWKHLPVDPWECLELMTTQRA